ncbi:MAG: barstar family protein [Arenimonas sp.]|nr:barstar family protein [Arenimonas sp.]
MSVLWFDGLLATVSDAGVYFLPGEDIDELLEAAAVNRFSCLRVNLRGCADPSDLLLRVAGALQFPPPADLAGLVAALRSLRTPGTPGLVLLLEHSEDLRAHATGAFKAAMEVLQTASLEWARAKAPLWSFIALSQDEFDALD